MNLNLKKVLCLVCVFSLIAGSLCSCGKKKNNEESKSDSSAETVVSDEVVVTDVPEDDIKETAESSFETDINGMLYVDGVQVTVVVDDEVIPVEYIPYEQSDYLRMKTQYYEHLFENFNEKLNDTETAYAVFRDSLFFSFEELVWENCKDGVVEDYYRTLIGVFTDVNGADCIAMIQSAVDSCGLRYDIASSFGMNADTFTERYVSDLKKQYEAKAVFPLHLEFAKICDLVAKVEGDMSVEVPFVTLPPIPDIPEDPAIAETFDDLEPIDISEEIPEIPDISDVS